MVSHSRFLYCILIRKYGFDDFNQFVFVRGFRSLASVFYKAGDINIIDDGLVNGSGRLIRWLSKTVKRMQTGYIYHYS